ncbi:MAG TPA: hypothetical protein VL094_11360 [Sphingomonadaceae bacterium]|nr:hypothetical protein [Sphingomonadaceae bacterium]
MTVLALALLFGTAGLASLVVLVQSYTHGFAAFKTLRRALANCDDVVTARLKIVEQRPVRLQLVSSKELMPHAPQPGGLRAAA